ncbi:MAG: Stealth CR1 domain-containing protein [Hyphomonadaceae bacterium]
MKNSIKKLLKGLIKAVVPKPVLSNLWLKYRNFKHKQQTTTIRSLILSPEEQVQIDQATLPLRMTPDFLTLDWLTGRIREMGHVPIFFTISAHGSIPSICVPAHQIVALGETIIAIAAQYNLKLSYAHRETILLASHYSEIMGALENNSVTILELDSGAQSTRIRIEKWTVEDEVLIAPRANPITRKIYLEAESAKRFIEAPGQDLRALYDTPLAHDCTFEIDVVYTWVNSHDAEWQEMLAANKPTSSADGHEENDDREDTQEPDGDRYKNRDELKYSLRSLLKFAPWVRHIYIVSNCAPPSWFDPDNSNTTWVPHEDIIEEQNLPTFSSHAIESSIHRVPNLANHYIYFNDDVFLVKPMEKSDFFTPGGLAKVRFENYGMVHGDVREGDPDYLNAARNGQRLLKEKFGKIPTRLHTHSPFSIVKNAVEACEASFPESYKQTRARKFRTSADISPTSFLFPHFAYLSGTAVDDSQSGIIINSQGSFEKKFVNYSKQVLAGKTSNLPLSICINDGGGSAANDTWNQAVIDFMERTYTEASPAEKKL